MKKILQVLNTEGMRYLIIGGCTTLVNLVVYAFLCRVVHLNVNVSNIISIIVAIIFAYITNKLIVFRSHCSSFGELAAECARFVGARLATMAIDKGMPIEQVQQLLGHQSVDTTLQYAMVNQNNVKQSHKKYIA